MMDQKKLLKLIQELGGDKTDLDLFESISDDEEQVAFQAPKLDEKAALMKDLQIFLKNWWFG